MNPFSRNDWKKAARRAGQSGPADPLWFTVGLLVLIVILALLLQK